MSPRRKHRTVVKVEFYIVCPKCDPDFTMSRNPAKTGLHIPFTFTTTHTVVQDVEVNDTGYYLETIETIRTIHKSHEYICRVCGGASKKYTGEELKEKQAEVAARLGHRSLLIF